MYVATTIPVGTVPTPHVGVASLVHCVSAVSVAHSVHLGSMRTCSKFSSFGLLAVVFVTAVSVYLEFLPFVVFCVDLNNRCDLQRVLASAFVPVLLVQN